MDVRKNKAQRVTSAGRHQEVHPAAKISDSEDPKNRGIKLTGMTA